MARSANQASSSTSPGGPSSAIAPSTTAKVVCAEPRRVSIELLTGALASNPRIAAPAV
jgi:hypothetical protein